MEFKINELGRIGVLMGGYSSERDISLKSGKGVLEALKNEGCHAVAIDINVKKENEILDLIEDSRIDVAFIALHGILGEDGTIQAILEQANIPYTGSGVEASRTAINKIATQKLFKNHGINVPGYVSLYKKEKPDLGKILKVLKAFPMVIKPACEGSSIGVHIVHDEKEFELALDDVWNFGEKAMAEEFIEGRELTVGIIGQEPLPVVEVVPKSAFYDYQAKYVEGMTEIIVPADIHSVVASTLQHLAVKSHKVCRCRDFSRVDFILTDDLVHYVLEINTIPGFTPTSLLPKAAQARGIGFGQLCQSLVRLAYEKKKKDNPTSVSG